MLKPFLLDEFGFTKDVISTCFKSWGLEDGPLHCSFFRNWERRGCVKKVTTFITGWLRVWGKKIWMGLFQILSVHELHDQSEMIHCNFPALRPIKRYNNSCWPSSHLLVWSITGSYWRQEITLYYVHCAMIEYSIIQTPAYRSVVLEVLWIIWVDHTPILH